MLQCLRLAVEFEEIMALDAVNLTVHDGEVVAVMGPSGSGKTTLLRAIAGLQRLDVGTVAWDGRNLRDVPPHARSFGLMFQDYALFPHMTVGGNVEFGLRVQGTNSGERAARVDEVLTVVGLSDYANRPIHELSGGEQQRVALARTLAPSPRLILLDEPIGSLDRPLREHLITEMRSIFSTLGVTAIYVTHDRDEAFAIADTVAVMHHGRVIRKGTPEDLWSNPENEFVARILGFNAIVTAKVYAGWADLGWGKVATDLPAGEHRVAIPPHAVTIADTGSTEGRVLTSNYRAGSYHTEIAVGDTVLSATTSRRYQPDDRVAFHISAAELLDIGH